MLCICRTRVGASDTSTPKMNLKMESNEDLADLSGVPTSDYHTTMVFCTVQVG